MQWKQKLKILVAVIVMSFVVSCVLSGDKKKISGPLPIPDNYGPRTVKQITSAGENLRPHLSLDGHKLLYVSGHRSTHNNFQAYEKNLKTGQEKRITYQNGDVFEVHYYDKEKGYVYSSSTDELKENSPYIEKSLLAMKGHEANELNLKDDMGFILPRTEIYQTTLDSSKINRVTKKPLFDGDISIRGKRHELAYVRWSEKIPEVYILNVKTENVSRVGSDKAWTSDPAYSVDGDELAWVEKSTDSKWLLLTGSAYGKNGKLRYQSEYRIRDVIWSSNGDELFFSEHKDGNSEIYSLALETGCKRQVTFHSALDFHPYPTTDASKLYFTSDRSGTNQIYEINLDGLPPCSKTKPALE